MVDTGHVADMLDVGHHVGDRRMGLGMGVEPVLHRHLDRGIVGRARHQGRDLGIGRQPPDPGGLTDKARHKGHHDDAAVVGQPGQHRVRHIAVMGGHGPRRGMREDDRGLRHPQGVQHRLLRDMAQIDHHPQTVHLAHDILAERVQPAPFRRVRGAVGP